MQTIHPFTNAQYIITIIIIIKQKLQQQLKEKKMVQHKPLNMNEWNERGSGGGAGGGGDFIVLCSVCLCSRAAFTLLCLKTKAAIWVSVMWWAFLFFCFFFCFVFVVIVSGWDSERLMF